MNEHRKKVSAFFDRAATSYRKEKGSFTDHYFGQRLSLAISAAAVTPYDRTLDIGCGTGALYDLLASTGGAERYLGIDLSKNMLAASHIPPAQRQQLAFTDFDKLTPPDVQFDRIFALGLTTYLLSHDIGRFHQSVFDRLAPGGRAIISYTNAASWDFRWRSAVNRWGGKLLPKHRTLGRNFPIYATTPTELRGNLPASVRNQSSVIWLPASWPLPGFLPPSLIQRKHGGTQWRGDFIMIYDQAGG